MLRRLRCFSLQRASSRIWCCFSSLSFTLRNSSVRDSLSTPHCRIFTVSRLNKCWFIRYNINYIIYFILYILYKYICYIKITLKTAPDRVFFPVRRWGHRPGFGAFHFSAPKLWNSRQTRNWSVLIDRFLSETKTYVMHYIDYRGPISTTWKN